MFRTFWEKLQPTSSQEDLRPYRPQRPVFAVSNPALPRNMRSLFLASERYTMKYPLLKRSRMKHLKMLSHDKKWSQVFLTFIFVFLSVILLITITVLIVFLVQISREEGIDKMADRYLSETDQQYDGPIVNSHSKHSAADFHLDQPDRTLCYNTCWPYTAFRFESECRHGYCYCKGNGYHNLTCLPIFGDCIIHKNSSNAVAFFRGKGQTTFGCYTSPNSKGENQSQVYVISVLNGKEFDHTLMVNMTRLSGSSQVIDWPVKLVLASYYPAHWSVTTDSGIKLDSVLQISTVRAHQGYLTLNGKNFTEDNKHYIRHRSLVGYGDDRDSGHTHELLETVQSKAGYFTSFSGSKHADTWKLSIGQELTTQVSSQLSNSSVSVNTIEKVTDTPTNTTIMTSER